MAGNSPPGPSVLKADAPKPRPAWWARRRPAPGDRADAGGWTRLSGLLPSRLDYAGIATSWRADVIAGVTVAVVALPLALGFGVATGLGARAGIVTAIVAGFVAAVFGGSNVQVSGPTGAMTVVLVPIVARHGADAVYLVALMAGVLVVAAGVGGLGKYLAYVPWPVVEGFTVGIAATIFLQEVPAAIGVPKPHGQNVAALAARAIGHIAAAQPAAIGITVLVAGVMIIGPRLHRSLPASLIAVGAATIVAEAANLHIARIGALPTSLPSPSIPALSTGQVTSLFGAAVAVAALAALESLMSARVADGMSDAPHHDPDRELLGQGLANLVSPLFGGMPATGAIARTAVNVRSGARTRLAAVVHAGTLLVAVLVGGSLMSRIPIAALAAVLMVTAARMVEQHNVRAVLRSTASDALVLAVTVALTIAFDLIFAVEVGVGLAAILVLRKVARAATATPEAAAVEIDPPREQALLRQHILTYRLDGALFFGAAQRFLTELTNVTDVHVVVLRMPELQVLDATGAQALGQIIEELEHRHITVLVKGLHPEHERILRAVGSLDHLAHEHHLFSTLDDAISHARHHISQRAH